MDRSPKDPRCRFCGAALTLTMADLGMSPVANDLVSVENANRGETFLPLRAMACRSCHLVQAVHGLAADEIFRPDYVYFSSHSSTWLAHAKRYVDAMVRRFSLGPTSRIIEIASNDGYLLQHAKAHGFDVLGIEPCRSVAAVAREKGIETHIAFFGRTLAGELVAQGHRADLLVANNVLAHVPDIADFVGGAALILAPEGIATFEVQHLLRLMQRHQFDTIYHEHYSYLSLIAAKKIFASVGLRVFDVESLDTHGGSIRFFVCHEGASHAEHERVNGMAREEQEYGLAGERAYANWSEKVRESKRALLSLLIDLKRRGKSIAAYGAPAKGVTLLNYCGIGSDFIDFAVDRAPSKIGHLLPGVRIPIHHPEKLMEARPDYILILPWNIKEEIKEQLSAARDWGAKFIVPIPTAHVE